MNRGRKKARVLCKPYALGPWIIRVPQRALVASPCAGHQPRVRGEGLFVALDRGYRISALRPKERHWQQLLQCWN